MKLVVAITCLTLSQAVMAGPKLSAADEAAAFKAAGFKQQGKQWKACKDSSSSYEPGKIEQVADFNGDGRPEVVITEGSTACYGDTGVGYNLVSKQADGSWKLMTNGIGLLMVQKAKGKDGWPDIVIGGPGFCFPIQRWNGSEYKVIGKEYEGKPCKR